ncbi:chorismate synthase [bacterium]|nr:chorismate synthase [bacterium]
MSNVFGRLLRLTTFGESHGPAIGGVLDGVPAAVSIDWDAVQAALARRRPGQSSLSTTRSESDVFEILSGVYEGKTTGAPLAFLFRNQDVRSRDYQPMATAYRPAHADAAYDLKYGLRDPRGGGRSSARETANWVFAGALARQLVPGFEPRAWVDQVGPIRLVGAEEDYAREAIEASSVRCPEPETAAAMTALIEQVRSEGDSVGGAIRCVLHGVPLGLGEPVFDKFQARLAQAMLSLNAVKGFEYGSGFEAASMKGSQHNDPAKADGSGWETNRAGGLLGGISDGRPISFRVGFKPTASIARPQQTFDRDGHPLQLEILGRHDPCVVPRAVPIVEALASLVVADFVLLQQSRRL